MAFQMAGKFIDEHGRTVYYDDKGNHSLKSYEVDTQNADPNDPAGKASPFSMVGSNTPSTPTQAASVATAGSNTPAPVQTSSSSIASKWNDPSVSIADKAAWMRSSGLTVDDITNALKASNAVYTTDPTTLRSQVGNALSKVSGFNRGDFGYAPGIMDTYIQDYKPATKDDFLNSVNSQIATGKAEWDRGVRAGPVGANDVFTPLTAAGTNNLNSITGTATGTTGTNKFQALMDILNKKPVTNTTQRTLDLTKTLDQTAAPTQRAANYTGYTNLGGVTLPPGKMESAVYGDTSDQRRLAINALLGLKKNPI